MFGFLWWLGKDTYYSSFLDITAVTYMVERIGASPFLHHFRCELANEYKLIESVNHLPGSDDIPGFVVAVECTEKDDQTGQASWG